MPIEGIDVSNNNAGNLPDPGYEFLFVKVSEGVAFRDKFFAGYVSEAQRQGLHWGPYHFARPDLNSAEAEAEWFLQHATRGPLGWALDVESRRLFDANGVPIGTVNPLAILGASRLAVWVERFRELVAPTLGPSWLYSNRDYASSLYPRVGSEWRTWLATLDGHPHVTTFEGRTIDIEQYAIVEKFDRNLARTTLIHPSAGEDDDMVPPAIVQLVDTNGDLVVIPGGGGRPWTAKATDAGLIAVFVFRALDPDPTRRYRFPDPIPVIADPAQVATFRAWVADTSP